MAEKILTISVHHVIDVARKKLSAMAKGLVKLARRHT
jgi:hypothetical protein